MGYPQVSISAELREGLGRAIEAAGNRARFARSCGVAPSQLMRWLGLTDECGTMSWRSLAAIWPNLAPHVAENCRRELAAELRQRNLLPATGAVRDEPSEPYQVAPPAATSARQCLVYGVANCLSSAHGIGDLVPESAAALEAVPTPPTLARRRRVAAFRAVDTSMEGPDPATSIRPGDLLYIDPDAELYDGAIALVKVEDEILCKLWCREGESVRLASYSPGVPPRTVEGRRVAWAYRVVFVQPAGRPV
jgi:phage repressor protein C with HTH and peptisase S24 domain